MLPAGVPALIDYFGAMAGRSGGKVGYQTLINSALREYVEGKTPKWEDTLRRIIREEMSRAETISPYDKAIRTRRKVSAASPIVP